MVNCLLATTALTLSAGVAAADVSLSGDGRMGLIYDGNDVSFTSRARVTFTLSGETDSGLAFGGSFRADNAGGAASGTAGNVFISGDFGRLAMGDVAGAARAAVGDLHGVGLTGLGDLNEMAYIGRVIDNVDDAFAALNSDTPEFSNRPRALYTYSIDAFSFYASVDNPVTVRDTDDSKVASLRNVAIGASYSFDGFTVAAGYEDARIKNFTATPTDTISAKHLIASAQYDMDGISVKAIAGRVSGDLGTFLADEDGLRRTQYGLSVSGSFDATTVTAFANRNFATTDYGIGASYDLGGGASFVGGIARSGSNNTLEIERNTVADLGLSFSF